MVIHIDEAPMALGVPRVCAQGGRPADVWTFSRARAELRRARETTCRRTGGATRSCYTSFVAMRASGARARAAGSEARDAPTRRRGRKSRGATN